MGKLESPIYTFEPFRPRFLELASGAVNQDSPGRATVPRALLPRFRVLQVLLSVEILEHPIYEYFSGALGVQPSFQSSQSQKLLEPMHTLNTRHHEPQKVINSKSQTRILKLDST